MKTKKHKDQKHELFYTECALRNAVLEMYIFCSWKRGMMEMVGAVDVCSRGKC